MTLQTIAFIALLVLSLVVGGTYTMLGLEAKAHMTSEASESDRSIGWLFWWSWEKRLYDPEGQRLCRKGNFLVLPLIALYIAWYFLLVKK